MEEQDADREHEQGAAGQQHGEARGLLARAVAVGIVQPAGEVVIDGLFGDGDNADEACDRHGAEQVEHDGRSEPIGGESGKHRRDRVAGVIEGLVTANPPGKGGVAEDAERDGRNRRRKDHGGSLCYSLRDRDRQERRKQRQ